jgi:DNA-binding cell septation regulator SpoVG
MTAANGVSSVVDGLSVSEVQLTAGDTDVVLAYGSFVLNGGFVVRECKIIRTDDGPFVAMPSRVKRQRCPDCQHKNPVTAKFCNECGEQLVPFVGDPTRAHVDVAHPISRECRELLSAAFLKQYDEETRRA